MNGIIETGGAILVSFWIAFQKAKQSQELGTRNNVVSNHVEKIIKNCAAQTNIKCSFGQTWFYSVEENARRNSRAKLTVVTIDIHPKTIFITGKCSESYILSRPAELQRKLLQCGSHEGRAKLFEDGRGRGGRGLVLREKSIKKRGSSPPTKRGYDNMSSSESDSPTLS
jgi:hypothetical protein